jgi:hypothetical protein
MTNNDPAERSRNHLPCTSNSTSVYPSTSNRFSALDAESQEFLPAALRVASAENMLPSNGVDAA